MFINSSSCDTFRRYFSLEYTQSRFIAIGKRQEFLLLGFRTPREFSSVHFWKEGQEKNGHRSVKKASSEAQIFRPIAPELSSDTSPTPWQ